MTDKKISELTAITDPALDDEIEIRDVSDLTMGATGTNKAQDYELLLKSFMRSDLVTATSMTGTVALTDASRPIQRLNPNGADRIVTLPAYAVTNHPFLIICTGTGGYKLTVQNSAGAVTVSTLFDGAAILLIPDGAAGWFGIPCFTDSVNGNFGVYGGDPIQIRRNGQVPFNGLAYSDGVATATQFTGSKARGTLQAPTAAQLNNTMFRLAARGYGATAFPAAMACYIDLRCQENHTDAAQGNFFVIGLTLPGSLTLAEKIRVTGYGNVLIGNTLADPTGGGTPVLLLAQATGDPTGLPSNTAGIFTKDAGGTCELYGVDEAGNVTLNSPHAPDAPAWLYDETPGLEEVRKTQNMYLGRIKWTNEDRRNRLMQMQIDGLPMPAANNRRTFVAEETYAEYNQRTGAHLEVQDWNKTHAEFKKRRDEEIAAWKQAKKDVETWKVDKLRGLHHGEDEPALAECPPEYVVKPKPKWMR